MVRQRWRVGRERGYNSCFICHSRYGSGAVVTMGSLSSQRLRSAVAGIESHDPGIRLYTNRDGSVVTSGSTAVELLVGQVSSPVRWDLCMESFASDGVTGIIELLPAGALVGLAKRALKGVPTFAVKTPDDLAAAIEMLENS